jgi:uncharacterized protein YjeT (DUF2065 family)
MIGLGAALALGLGITLVIEGLVLALLPGRLEQIMALVQRIRQSDRRVIGLGMVALGVVVVWSVLRTTA